MSQNPKWPKTMSPTSKIIKTAGCLHHPFWSILLGTNAWLRCTISSSTKWQATGAPCAWLKHHGKLTGYHGYTTNDAISFFPYFSRDLLSDEWRPRKMDDVIRPRRLFVVLLGARMRCISTRIKQNYSTYDGWCLAIHIKASAKGYSVGYSKSLNQKDGTRCPQKL